MRKKRDAEKIKKIALERIDILMNLVEKEYKNKNINRVNNYINLSKKIAMKVRIPFPKKWKRRICKNCNSFLVYGDNCKVKIDSKEQCVKIKCLNCDYTYRIPYIKEKKEKRKMKHNKNSNTNKNSNCNNTINNNTNNNFNNFNGDKND